MSNPLIEKYFEIYPEKKEKPKKVEQKKVGYELPEEFLNLYGNLPSTTSVTTPTTINPNSVGAITAANHIPKIISYDTHSIDDSFFQIAEKIKNKDAKVVSMHVNNEHYRKSVTFEVLLDT